MSNFRVTMKDPDYKTHSRRFKISDEEMKDAVHEWLEYGEYLTIEIDTKKKTCVVIAPSRRDDD